MERNLAGISCFVEGSRALRAVTDWVGEFRRRGGKSASEKTYDKFRHHALLRSERPIRRKK